VKRLLVPLLLALAAAGCGSGEESAAPAPATLSGSALQELDSRQRTLDAETLAEDSYGPEALARVLAEGGYTIGSEREFSGKSRTFDHVVARTLHFESAAGAESYLDWLRLHPDDFLGRSEPAKLAPPGQSGVAFALAACGSCKKEVPTFLAGWRRGEVVLTLLAGGSGANTERFSSLAHELVQTVG